MTEKVSITQEQADEIKEIQEAEYAINIHSFNKRPDKAIASLTTAELARALYIGYEIKRKYREGDVVRYWRNDVNNKVGEIERINYEEGWVGFNNSVLMHKISDIQRMATAEEYRREKERQKWSRIGLGRKVGEIKDGDVGVINSGQKIFSKTEMEAAFLHKALIGIYPTESYVSLMDGEAE